MTRIGLALAGVGMVALLGACGGDDFTDLSGQEIADASKAAMKDVDAVKVSGTISSSGNDVTIDLQLNDQGDCTGSIGVAGGTAELREVGDDLWVKPDEAFWKASAGDSADQIIAVVGDKWAVLPTASDSFKQFCDIDSLFEELVKKSDDSTYKKKDVTDLDGVSVIPLTEKDKAGEVAVASVRVDEPHYIVKIEKTGGGDTGSVTFSEFDKDFDVEAPPASDVVDLSSLGG